MVIVNRDSHMTDDEKIFIKELNTSLDIHDLAVMGRAIALNNHPIPLDLDTFFQETAKACKVQPILRGCELFKDPVKCDLLTMTECTFMRDPAPDLDARFENAKKLQRMLVSLAYNDEDPLKQCNPDAPRFTMREITSRKESIATKLTEIKTKQEKLAALPPTNNPLQLQQRDGDAIKYKTELRELQQKKKDVAEMKPNCDIDFYRTAFFNCTNATSGGICMTYQKENTVGSHSFTRVINGTQSSGLNTPYREAHDIFRIPVVCPIIDDPMHASIIRNMDKPPCTLKI